MGPRRTGAPSARRLATDRDDGGMLVCTGSGSPRKRAVSLTRDPVVEHEPDHR
jgi:hypothetical protein